MQGIKQRHVYLWIQLIWHVWINNEKVDNKAAADWSLTEDKQEAKDFDKRFVTET